MDGLIKGNVRVVIPFKDSELHEFIEIKNPNEYIIKNIKTRVIDRINGKDDFDNSEILEYLIKELTNVKLDKTINELLLEDLSHECKMLLYHITDIYNEMQEEILCVVKMDLAKKKITKLEEELVAEMQQV